MGLIKTNGLEEGFQSSKCYSYSLIEEFQQGNGSNGWAGLTGNIQSFEYLRVLLRNTVLIYYKQIN